MLCLRQATFLISEHFSQRKGSWVKARFEFEASLVLDFCLNMRPGILGQRIGQREVRREVVRPQCYCHSKGLHSPGRVGKVAQSDIAQIEPGSPLTGVQRSSSEECLLGLSRFFQVLTKHVSMRHPLGCRSWERQLRCIDNLIQRLADGQREALQLLTNVVLK